MLLREQNAFNYPQFGNPLNPVTGYAVPANSFLGTAATSVPTPQILDSGHPFGVRRRMSDFNLTILPQAKVTMRLARGRPTGRPQFFALLFAFPLHGAAREGSGAARLGR